MKNKTRESELPDLDGPEGNQSIIADNIRALQPVYFAAMLDEMKAFQVLDRIVELFQAGMLPVGKGKTGSDLFRYWKEKPLRMSEKERRNLYTRVLGFPGGDAGTISNREFNDLWIRFISSVADFARQSSVGDLRRTNSAAINQQLIRKAARELAANLSLHGYGSTYYVAVELHKQINTITRVLSTSEIKNACGARDMWQVIDQVAEVALGGAANTSRYRTMANAGATIVAWLADNSRKLSSANDAPILNAARLGKARRRQAPVKPPVRPTDSDLVNACEQWLGVIGITNGSGDDFSRPRKTP